MELGSEFNLKFENIKEEQNTIYEFLKGFNTIYLDSGRSGLRLLCGILHESEVLLPEYICDSVLQCFEGKTINYYKLKNNLEIDVDDLCNKINRKTSAVYLIVF